MGRGREGVIKQGCKKKKKECGPLPKKERKIFRFGSKNPVNQTIVDIPEEVLNEVRQLNSHDVVNILVNP